MISGGIIKILDECKTIHLGFFHILSICPICVLLGQKLYTMAKGDYH